MNKKRLFSILASVIILMTALAPSSRISYAADRTFPETGKSISGTFLDYWDTHGGLAQQGYPISEERDEASDTDGQTYTVQYFERAVFELHPENAAPYDVLLSLLGANLYNSKYNGNAPGQTASNSNPRTFQETGKTLGGVFRKYWEQHGGLAQQGFPISNEFKEKSDTDGKTYTVQYFERAVFELHPENAGKPSEVLLSLLGSFRLKGGSGTPVTPPTPPNAPDRLTVPGWTHITVTANKIAIFYNATTGVAYTARLGNDGSLTLLQRYPEESKGHDEFGKGWTSMEAGPDNQVLLYAAGTGDILIIKAGDDGQISVKKQYPNDVAGFNKITIDPLSGFTFWQNKDKNTTSVIRLGLEGFLSSLKEGPATGGIASDLMVPVVLGGLWYDYAPDTGQVNVYTINAKGELVGAAPPANVGKGVTQIVSNYYSHAAFYSKSEGLFLTAKILGPYGQPAQVQITNATKAEKSWSIVAATQTAIIICYDDKGDIQTNVLTENGVIAPVKL
ncbi:MAG: hypothetical protein ABIQ44_00685, partial [Chloroflexia bacterium]